MPGPGETGEQVIRLQIEAAPPQGQAPNAPRERGMFDNAKKRLAQTAVCGVIAAGGVYGVVWTAEKIGGIAGDVAGAVKDVVGDGAGAVVDGAKAVGSAVGGGAKAIGGAVNGAFDGKTAETELEAEISNVRFPYTADLFRADVSGESRINLPASALGIKAPFGLGDKKAHTRREASVLIQAEGTKDHPAIKIRAVGDRLKAVVDADSLRSHLLDTRLPVDKKGQIIPDEGDEGLLVRYAAILPFAKSKPIERASKLAEITQTNMRATCGEHGIPFLEPFAEEYVRSVYATLGKERSSRAPVDVSFVDSMGQEVKPEDLKLHGPAIITAKSVAARYGVDKDNVSFKTRGCVPDPKTTRMLAQTQMVRNQNLGL